MVRLGLVIGRRQVGPNSVRLLPIFNAVFLPDALFLALDAVPSALFEFSSRAGTADDVPSAQVLLCSSAEYPEYA